MMSAATRPQRDVKHVGHLRQKVVYVWSLRVTILGALEVKLFGSIGRRQLFSSVEK
jgi:hypothetical protein